MSKENVDIVRRGYEAWNRRDFDEVIELMDPKADWGFLGASRFPGIDASYHGHDGIREFWQLFIEPWEDFSIAVQEARDAGDVVVLFVVFHAKGRHGLEVNSAFTHLLWLREGKVVRFRSFDDRKAALEAAGLSE